MMTYDPFNPPPPSDPVPSDPVPSDPVPSDPVPSDPVPSDPVPSDPVPSDPVPSDPVPSDPVPSDPVPNNGSSTIDQRYDSITAGGDVTSIGQQNIYNYVPPKQDEEQPPVFVPFEINQWRSIEDVYVAPHTLNPILDAFHDAPPRLLIVAGPRRSGRGATAVHLGIRLMKTQGTMTALCLYDRRPDERRSLRDAVDWLRRSEQHTLPTAYILENAEPGVIAHAAQYRITLGRALAESEAFFILTTDMPPDEVKALGLPVFNAVLTPEQIAAVYDRHLARYAAGDGERFAMDPALAVRLAQTSADEPGDAAVTLRERVITALGGRAGDGDVARPPAPDVPKPALIRQFFDALAGEPLTGVPEEDARIEAVARRIGSFRYEPPRAWWARLNANERLFAMLVYLFQGFPRLPFNSIYSVTVGLLREAGVTTLRDAREFGLTDLLEAAHAVETKTRTLRFEHDTFRAESGYQVANFYHQLWPLVDPLVTVVKAQFKDPASWPLREIIGNAIGRLGIHTPIELTAVLDGLVEDQNGSVVNLTGYALAEIARLGVEHYPFVLDETLKRWANTRKYDPMWAAAAGWWLVYDTLAEAAASPDDVVRAKGQAALTAVHDGLTALARVHDVFEHNYFEAQVKTFLLKYAEDMKAMVERNQAGQSNVLEQLILRIESLKTPEQMLQQARERLRAQLGGNVRSAITHAVLKIHLRHAGHIVPVVASWLSTAPAEDRSAALRLVGLEVAARLFRENTDDALQLEEARHKPLLSLIGPFLFAAEQAGGRMDDVRTLVRGLLSWLRAYDALVVLQSEEARAADAVGSGHAGDAGARTDWRDEVHRALLHAVNRASQSGRVLVRTALSDLWLSSDFAPARTIGQAIIARSLVMDGEPLMLPGGQRGLLVVSLGAQARTNGASIEAGRRLYELLEPRIDMDAAFMGTHGVSITQFSDMVNYHTLSLGRYAHALPNLLMPVLEPLDPARYAFVLLLGWGDIVDLDDVQETAWHDRLIFIGSDQSVKATLVMGNLMREKMALVLPADWYENVGHIADVRRIIGTRLACTLAVMPPDTAWQMLQPYLEHYLGARAPGRATVRAMVAALQQMTDNLDQIEQARHPRDVTRTIACALLWLATTDLNRAVGLLSGWLRDTTRADGLNRLMGSAGAQLLFNVFAYAEPVMPVSRCGSFLRLLAPIADNLRAHGDTNAAAAALEALRRWVRDEAWYAAIMRQGRRPPVRGVRFRFARRPVHTGLRRFARRAPLSPVLPIDRLADAARDTHASWLSASLDVLDRPIAYEGETELSRSVHQWITHMRLRLAAGGEQAMPALREGERYGLVLVDVGSRGRGAQPDAAAWAAALYEALKREVVRPAAGRNPPLAVYPMLYRMGSAQPLAVGVDGAVSADALIAQARNARPRLLGPVLARSDLAERAAFAVLITDAPPLDADDWADAWRGRLLVYTRQPDQPGWPAGARMIERVKGDSARAKDAKEHAEQVRRIVERIMAQVRPLAAPVTGGAAADARSGRSAAFDPAADTSSSVRPKFDPTSAVLSDVPPAEAESALSEPMRSPWEDEREPPPAPEPALADYDPFTAEGEPVSPPVSEREPPPAPELPPAPQPPRRAKFDPSI
jgi:hypothetical protein